MNIFLPSVTIEFEEPRLADPIPACLPYVAAALTAGFRLAKDGSPNHMDVLVGPKHLQDFKKASSRQLRRLISWRFRAETKLLDNCPCDVLSFISRLQSEPSYLVWKTKEIMWARWLSLLIESSCKNGRILKVENRDEHQRVLIVKVVEVSKMGELIKFVDHYENGI